ncbi:transferase [Tanacetum coccineum]
MIVCEDAGREAHVMTFEVGAALEDAKWQVPSYCFEQTNATEPAPMDVGAITHRGLVDSSTRKVEDMQN